MGDQIDLILTDAGDFLTPAEVDTIRIVMEEL